VKRSEASGVCTQNPRFFLALRSTQNDKIYRNLAFSNILSAFLQLGRTLEECAARYRQFCRKYQPKPKPEKRNHWDNHFLPSMKNKGKGKKSPGQMSLPWDKQRVTEDTEVHEVAEKFIQANSSFQGQVSGLILPCIRGL